MCVASAITRFTDYFREEGHLSPQSYQMAYLQIVSVGDGLHVEVGLTHLGLQSVGKGPLATGNTREIDLHTTKLEFTI